MSEKVNVVDAEFTPKEDKERLEKMKLTEPKGLLKPLLVLAVCLGVALFGFSKGVDNDLWFMIAHGNYLFENGFHFPTTEILTIHSDFAFSLEKWASCVAFAGVYNLFGEWGVQLFGAGIFALVLFLIYKAAMLISDKNFWVSILGTVLAGVPLAIGWATTRPQIFSYLFLILEFIVLEKYVKTGNKKFLYALPVLSLLLMQFHSTMWIMFLIVLMPYIFLQIKVGRFVPDNKYKPMEIFKFGVISIFAALINPYGFVSMAYLFNSFGSDAMGMISELNPITYGAIPYFVPFALFTGLWLKLNKDKEVPVRYLWFALGTFAMSLVAIRNVSYFLLFSIFMPVYMWKDTRIKAQNLTVIVLIALGLAGGPYIFYDGNAHDELRKSTACASIVDDFAETIEDPSQIRLWTSFNEGSYAEFKGFKVYIDPRAEVFSEEINGKEDILQEFSDLRSGSISFQEIQDKYEFDYWLVSKKGTFSPYIRAEYELIMEDDDYMILKPVA